LYQHQQFWSQFRKEFFSFLQFMQTQKSYVCIIENSCWPSLAVVCALSK